jgi:hypothetical protein
LRLPKMQNLDVTSLLWGRKEKERKNQNFFFRMN